MRIPAIILILIFVSSHSFAQDDYELFGSYSSREIKAKNTRLLSITEYNQDILDRWKQISFETFNATGLPMMVLKYNVEGKLTEKKVFTYTTEGYIANIETYRNGTREQSAEFVTDLMGKVLSCSTYGYNSENGKKVFDSKISIEYNSNGTLSRVIKLRSDAMDTALVERYDTGGIKIESISRDEEHWTTRREYHWNADKSQMEEHVSIGACPEWTITHFYKDGQEVGRTDTEFPSTRFYWKYNAAGWLLETNAPMMFVQYNTYENRGYLKTVTLRNTDPEANLKDQPNKLEFKFEYQFRN